MKTKYTFLNEGISINVKRGIFGAAAGALAGTVLSGIAALIVRCKGSEKLREKELDILKFEITSYEERIKNLTRLMKEEHLEDKQNYYKKELDRCRKELTKLSAQYKIVESMSLEDLRKMMAKKRFARGMATTALMSVSSGIGIWHGSKYGF